jgi:hypothetical protein
VTDRIADSLLAIVREEIAKTYPATYEYAIKGVHGTPPNVTIDCEPTDPAIGLPALTGISMQPGIAGITGIPAEGINCAVIFLNGSPTRPRIVGVDSSGVNPIARLGDAVQSFLPPTLPVVGTVSGNPFVGTITVANPISGIIQGGSGKAFTG